MLISLISLIISTIIGITQIYLAKKQNNLKIELNNLKNNHQKISFISGNIGEGSEISKNTVNVTNR